MNYRDRVSVCTASFLLMCMVSGFGEDWPMWRYDSGRTAASPEILSDELHLQWTRRWSPRQPAWDDPLNRDLMTYDRLFEPVVVQNRLFIGFNDRDKVSAFDLGTGNRLWDYFADGPVRLPLAASDDSIFFSSDDGCLYCVNAADGQLRWQFRGGPGDRRAIGNQRLVSAWPSRGGPVIRDGNVYFASSIWPFMGVFIYCLDAETGHVIWKNDETGAQYLKQPHSAPSFAGIGPQGALVATDETLIVPGGRSVPAVLDRKTGVLRYFEINAGGKGTGGSFVAARDNSWFVHTRFRGTREFALDTGIKTAFLPNEPVLAEGVTYSAEVENGQPVIRAYDSERKIQWQIAADGRGDLIQAGNVLYAASSNSAEVTNSEGELQQITLAGPKTVSAVQLPSGDAGARILWTKDTPATVERLIAASGRLIGVTVDGQILVWGAEARTTPQALVESEISPASTEKNVADQASEILSAGDAQGYSLWYGAADESLLNAVASQSEFVQLAVIDRDAERVDSFRRRWDREGRYGRVTAQVSSPDRFLAPPYAANMVFTGREETPGVLSNLTTLKLLFESVRPYGGVLQLLASTDQAESFAQKAREAGLEQAEVEVTGNGVLIRRAGALPGSADWTHQHGNIANTVKSNDRRVKLPLGILWFGGSSNSDILPRHGHGPPEQVVGGRLIIQGMNSLTARDVYTGRTLWKREFSDLGTAGVYYDETYRDAPLDPAYNQIHIPGANARGTNYVVTTDLIYVVEGSECRVLNPVNGELVRSIALPQENPTEPHEWGFIGVYDDVLIGGIGFARYQNRLELTAADVDGETTPKRAVFGSRSLERAASTALVGFDRHTGRQLWKIDSLHSFWHNGIVAGNGRVYALDRNPKPVEEALRRRGRAIPATYRIISFDAHTGETVWETSEGIFGTWLGYSEPLDLLLQAGAAASDRLASEVGQGMTVYNGKDGGIAWRKESLAYSGPCILHNDLIITNANSYSESAGAFYLRDGTQKLVKNPLTGKLQPWKITRAYGCNNILASENMLTFRSGAAGFYDLLTESGTGNLGGFKSGCTSNLVVANGVLNAPDYTRTCSCAYQNQTSLALVHMPELELWTIDNAAMLDPEGDRVNRMGINFGAPGDRRDQNGLLWLEYPFVGGDSPDPGIQVLGSFSTWQDHPTSVPDSELPWVMASGLEGMDGLRVGLKGQNKDKLSTGISVSHSDDDAEEGSDGGVSTGSSDLELVNDDDDQIIGIRINRVNIARDGEVRSAFLQFACHSPSPDPTELVIRAELSANPSRFAERSRNISERSLTVAAVKWAPAEWKKAGDAGPEQRTPDLAPLIREVVQQTDWQPGNSIVFIITGKGKRTATAFAKGAGAARLIADADEVTPESLQTAPEQPWRVRLYFGLPENTSASARTFDVVMQGQTVLQNVSIGGVDAGRRVQVHTIDRVLISEWLDLQFVAKQGKPVLSGIEMQLIEE